MNASNQALTTQIGGNHYATMKYQPIQFAMDAQLNPVQFSIVKYVSRYKNKNGLQDLQKALHFCEIGAEIDKTPVSDDTFFITVALDRYTDENHLSIRQYLAIASATSKNYTMASTHIRDIIAESDQ